MVTPTTLIGAPLTVAYPAQPFLATRTCATSAALSASTSTNRLGPELEDAEMMDMVRPDPSSHLVLIVDDDCRIRRYIKTILRSANFQVLEAADGLEALEVFYACGKIDLVITDIRMPRMTGTDLAISLRSDRPAIPLIFVSGEPVPADMVDPKKGICFVAKPFAPNALLETANQIFN